MAAFVIDSSVAAAWCFPDEQTGYTNGVLATLSDLVAAVAPRLFAYEVRNTILMGVRRGRIQRSEAGTFLASLHKLPIRFADPESYDRVFELAETHRLTFYDAAYLDLALRGSLPIASLDRALVQAAAQSGVSVFQP